MTNYFPIFPHFKKLELSDKDEFEAIVNQFEPYSDFNFVSLWSYNTQEDCSICLLHDNLVIKMNDYITLKPFCTFIGQNKVIETISSLLEFTQAQQISPNLKLVPAVNFEKSLSEVQNLFLLTEDRDSYDYIYSLDQLVAAEGGAYKVLRNMLSKFNRSTESFSLNLSNLKEPEIKEDIIHLVYVWGKHKNKTSEEIENELTGIKRLLASAAALDLTCLCLQIDGQLKAFFISEKIDDEYVLAHFRKADPSIPGIFQFIDYENAKSLQQLGCKYLNYEQDLGIPSLRQSKQSLNPVKFLEKYSVAYKE